MAAIAKAFAISGTPVAALAFGERYLLNLLASDYPTSTVATLLGPIQTSQSGITSATSPRSPSLTLPKNFVTLNTFTVSKAYGLVGLVNVVGSSMLMIFLGMKVGMSRKTYGVDYPTMYATGTDEKSKTFNCIQRGHQNALESYPQFLALSLIAGLRHPILTTLFGAVWIFSRYKFMEGYSCGDPAKRYGSWWAQQHWKCLIGLTVLSVSTCCGLLNEF